MNLFNMEAVKEWLLKNLIFSLILTFIIIYIIRKIINKNQNLPPGPNGLPIVGCLPFIGKHTPERICKLIKKYGGIFGLYIGSRYTVVLTDYPSIKQGLNNSFLSARPPGINLDILDWYKFTKTGFGGKYWIEQRRFMMSVLHDLGLGKIKLEEIMMNEISILIKELKSQNGKPTFTEDILASSVRNTICFLVCRKRFEYNSEERKLLDKSILVYGRSVSQTAIQIFIPWLRPILIYTGIFGFKESVTASKILYNFIDKEIEEHEKTLDVNNIRDYIDYYLIELQKRENEYQSYFSKDTKIQGFRIPKGTIIMSNISDIHNDVEYWKDPEAFRPEIFLDETGKKLIGHDFYIPFGLGKLSCPGENMAKIETFLFFVTVMQQFTIKPPDGETLDMEGTLDISYAPISQKLCFFER